MTVYLPNLYTERIDPSEYKGIAQTAEKWADCALEREGKQTDPAHKRVALDAFRVYSSLAERLRPSSSGNPNVEVYVCKDTVNDANQGIMILDTTSRQVLRIEELAVSPGNLPLPDSVHRINRVGTQLLRHAEKRAEDQEKSQVAALSIFSAVGFYEHSGFAPVAPSYGTDPTEMVKPLARARETA